MQLQKPQRVRHCRTTAPHFERDVFLPHSKFVGQPGVTLGFFDWVEVCALQIFNQGQLEHFQVIGASNYDGHRSKADFLRGAPAALASDQFKSGTRLADD